jgi:hypothetical protein
MRGNKEDPRPRFALGGMRITPFATDALQKSGDNVALLIRRHMSGDWGDLDDYDKTQNDEGVERGLRILSSYTLSSGDRLWVITEGDRSATTVMTPDEY